MGVLVWALALLSSLGCVPDLDGIWNADTIGLDISDPFDLILRREHTQVTGWPSLPVDIYDTRYLEMDVHIEGELKEVVSLDGDGVWDGQEFDIWAHH